MLQAMLKTIRQGERSHSFLPDANQLEACDSCCLGRWGTTSHFPSSYLSFSHTSLQCKSKTYYTNLRCWDLTFQFNFLLLHCSPWSWFADWCHRTEMTHYKRMRRNMDRSLGKVTKAGSRSSWARRA